MSAGAPGSTANAINLSTSVTGRGAFHSIRVILFQTGLSLSSSASTAPIIVIENITSAANTTCIVINNVQAIIENGLFIGPISGTTPANTAISATGSNSTVSILSSTFRLLTTGISITGAAQMRIGGSNFSSTTNSIACSGGSFSAIVGCMFLENNSSSVNIAGSGSGTEIHIVGCNLQCNDITSTDQGTAFQVSNQASIFISSSIIEHAVIAIQCGTSGDAVTTSLKASGVTLSNCTTDINQVGSSMLQFVGGIFDETKLNISDPTNVSFAAFDVDADLVMGSGADVKHTIYEILNGESILPELNYEPNYYRK